MTAEPYWETGGSELEVQLKTGRLVFYKVSASTEQTICAKTVCFIGNLLQKGGLVACPQDKVFKVINSNTS